MNILVIIKLILFLKCILVFGQTNMTIFRELPPLYDLENYDHCLNQQLSTYCVVFAEIESNPYNDIWIDIEILSTDPLHNFRHQNIFFGVCIEPCKELLDNMSALELEQLSRNKSIENEITDFHKKVHKRKEDHENRINYQHILEVCLNNRFQKKYNLTISTSIEYCEKPNETYKIDTLDIIFFTISVTLIFLNIISSLYDYRLKLQQKVTYENNDFYKIKLKDPGHILLTSFSICRNYYRITYKPPKEINPTEADLKFTYAFRVFTLFIVILGHCIMVLMAIQIQNPELIEKLLHMFASMLFQNGQSMIQIFFVLAGFLLKLKFDQMKIITSESSLKKGVFVYIHAILNRYLRLIPSVLLLVLFNVTLLIRLGNGPFWRRLTDPEYVLCRENWWKNVFMVNNFMLRDSCGQHTWYLAADMQLYALFLFIVILTAKFSVLRKPIYILLGIFALAMPGILTYIYKLDAFHFATPETFRYLYFKDLDAFFITYSQFYCNLSGYLVGFMCAEFYMKYITQSDNQKKDKFLKYRGVMKYEIPLIVVIFVVGFSLLLSGNLVVDKNIEKPSILLSLYASMYRNLWCIFCGFFLLCMLLKMGWMLYEMACLNMFRILGRISFQTYLWHVTILRILAGLYRQPVFMSVFYMSCQILVLFILTNLVAFFVTLCVEFPIGTIINYIFKPKISKDQSDETKPNGTKPHLVQIQT